MERDQARMDFVLKSQRESWLWEGGSEREREIPPCKLETSQGRTLPVAKTLGIAFPKVRVCKFCLSQHFAHWEVMGTQPSSLSHGDHMIE